MEKLKGILLCYLKNVKLVKNFGKDKQNDCDVFFFDNQVSELLPSPTSKMIVILM